MPIDARIDQVPTDTTLSRGQPSATGSRIERIYTSLAVQVVNTLVLLVMLNVAAFLVLAALAPGPRTNVVAEKYGVDLKAYYPGMSDADINALLQETWSRTLVFEPFTQFTEPASRGRFVNVSPAGYRYGRDKAPWPIDRNYFNIFFFGGSTAFGVGVPDGETIPSALQDLLNQRGRGGLPVRVYNFGRSHYYSSQERALLTQLLARGAIPDVAIFLDGLNDFYYNEDLPNYTEQFDIFMSGEFSRLGSATLVALRLTPLARLLDEIARSAFGKRPRVPVVPRDETAVIAAVLNRYETNQKLIRAVAQAYQVRTVFVWQPVPTHGYDLTQHVFGRKDGFGRHAISGPGYERMRQNVAMREKAGDFVWCADAHRRSNWPHYLDIVHYTASMSKSIAACVADLAEAELSGAR